MTGSSRHFPLAPCHVGEHCRQDQQAEDGAQPVGGDIQEYQSRSDAGEEDRGERRADHRAGPAKDGHAADDRGGDDGEFEIGRHRRLDDLQLRCKEKRRNAGKVRPVSVDGASPSEAYRQYWQAKKDAKNNVTYEFTKLEEIGADGHVARRLTFSAGKLTRVEYLRADGAFLKIVTIRSDQTVEKIETYTYPPNGGETVIDSKDVAPGAAMRESYDGKLLERAPFEDVRPLVGPPATPSWYGYEGYGY